MSQRSGLSPASLQISVKSQYALQKDGGNKAGTGEMQKASKDRATAPLLSLDCEAFKNALAKLRDLL